MATLQFFQNGRPAQAHDLRKASAFHRASIWVSYMRHAEGLSKVICSRQ